MTRRGSSSTLPASPSEASDDVRALLNILGDFDQERARLADTQKAVLNVLADSDDERARLAGTQRAVLNVLADSDDERARLADTQKAVLNVLADSDDERARLADTQRAVLNVLADSDDERARLSDMQRAVLNILDDLELEKMRVDRFNRELTNEVAERQRAEQALHELTGQLELQVRARTAELVATNRELEAFAYSAAHDLRTPLRTIAGFSQILLVEHISDGEDDERATLQRICDAAVRMGKLIDGLLTLARLTRTTIHESEVDLAALAREHLEELRSSAPERSLVTSIPEHLLAWGDARLLRLVVGNLLDNAVKFSASRGFAHIEVGQTSTEHGPAYFVRDDGVGFDARGSGLLFGQFQSLHRDRDFTGLGVGLAAVDRIVRRHNGRVWAESEFGKGATFYFQLGVAGGGHE